MKNLQEHPFRARGLLAGGAILVAMMLSACVSPEQARNDDRNTCSSMGAPYGSRAHTDCMLRQQQRGDEKMLILLEEQRMHQELGRPAREKLEEKRRREREKAAQQG